MLDSPLLSALLLLAAAVIVGVVIIELGIWLRRGWRKLFPRSEADAEKVADEIAELLDSVGDISAEDYDARLKELEEENLRLKEEIDESLFGG